MGGEQLGLKRADEFRLTTHCVERFEERFNLNQSESKDLIERYLGNSVYVRNAKNNCEMWANVDKNIIFILDIPGKLIKTVYKINDELNERIDETVAGVIEKALTDFKYQTIRKFGDDTQALYKDLGALTLTLSRTAQPKMLDDRMQDINVVRSNLNKRIKEHTVLMQSINYEIERVTDKK